MLALYDDITKRLQKGKSLGKVEVWRSVFGKSKPYNDVRFRKYTSDLFKLVREYLTQESLEEEPKLKDYLFLAALERQHPDKLIRGVERNWANITSFEEDADYNRYLYRHLLELRKYSLVNYEHRPYDRANVEEISSSLDIYYIVVKLRSAVDAQSRTQTEKQQYEIHLVDELVRFLETTKTYLDHTPVAIHYYMYKMLTTTDSEAPYYHYKNLLMERTDSLPPEQTSELFKPGLNYCRRRINEGRREFLAEYLEIYRYALDRELVYDDGVLDPLQFRNTILIALRHGDYDWAEHYIENYQDRLPPKQRANAVNYNSATLYFYQKNYDKALDFLRDVEYENTTYNLNAKTMLLAIYYETEEDIALDSLFDSITAYLNRHKELPVTAQQAFRNLVSYTRRLTRLLPGDQKALDQLKKDLAEKKYVASRPWLEEKIAEFEK
ncbi:hypothetical protein [Lewinella sp. W8]|uniref:hypothetical protein n=1 Tax=Lewinella sp. W8 TaxID=2528208 RepID=UPI00106821C2|nr:hypothetical protein [Lewinella sp. W8]MTB49710.1 hypothetical protein [Lewinella sp. W8]